MTDFAILRGAWRCAMEWIKVMNHYFPGWWKASLYGSAGLAMVFSKWVPGLELAKHQRIKDFGYCLLALAFVLLLIGWANSFSDTVPYSHEL
jgi:hypothetical protein